MTHPVWAWLSHAFSKRPLTELPRRSAVRLAHLEDFPVCGACGGFTSLEVHVAPQGLITLCDAYEKQCRLQIGCGGSWRKYNPNVKADADEALSCRRTFDRAGLAAVLDRAAEASKTLLP